MVRNSLFFILSLVSLTAFASEVDQPPLENARGIVVHNSVASSPFTLSVGNLLNCQETDDHYRTDCDLEETMAMIGDSPVVLHEVRFVADEVRFVADEDKDQYFYLFGKINLRGEDFSAERDILIGINVKADGSKRGYIKIDDLGLSEQLILESSQSFLQINVASIVKIAFT